MRQQFPLFNTPLDLTHSFWEKILTDGDAVIDATCGNGKDSLVLANLLKDKTETALFCLDIQQKAIDNTQDLLTEEASCFLPSIQFILGSHENLPDVSPRKPKLIVYNLGYLPGGDKTLTTENTSTLKSITRALEVICPGGVISINCYPGHPEGKKEQETLLPFLASLDPKLWSFTSSTWDNRNASPSLLLVQKSFFFDLEPKNNKGVDYTVKHLKETKGH